MMKHGATSGDRGCGSVVPVYDDGVRLSDAVKQFWSKRPLFEPCVSHAEFEALSARVADLEKGQRS